MLNTINRVYLLTAILLYTILAFKAQTNYFLVNLYAVISFISYFVIIYINSNLEDSYYSYFYLAIEVFFYVTIFVFLENVLSYYYRGNFFVFSEGDAITYHTFAKTIVQMPFSKGIEYYLNFLGFDDLGMMLVLYPLYLIVKSNLILNIFYIFVAVVTALSLFSLAQNFLSKRYAFLASLAYSLASFTLFFYASGLKESFMIMLIVLSYDFIYRFLKTKNLSFLFLGAIPLFLIIFFRPALTAMIILSFAIGAMFSQKGGIVVKILAVVIFLGLFAFSGQIMKMVNSYMAGGFDALIYARETQGMIKGGLPFTYMVNFISQTIGPLPTLSSPSNIVAMLYAPGLIYRVLLAIPFWLGVYYIYKKKEVLIYPITIFVFTEMASLIFLIDGLELRKCMPHMPFVFLIAFWFMDKYEKKEISIKNPQRFMEAFFIALFLLLFMMVYWNFR